MKTLMFLLIFSCAKNVPVANDGTLRNVRKEVYSTMSNILWVKDVARVSNCVLNNESFLLEIGRVEAFTHTKMKPSDVELVFRKFLPVRIATYQTRSPFSKTIATTYKTDRTTVYFSTRKNPRNIASMVNTAIHEGSHLNHFSHGNNSPAGKGKSVPYFTGKIAEKYTKDCK